jgi:hypothetical protein
VDDDRAAADSAMIALEQLRERRLEVRGLSAIRAICQRDRASATRSAVRARQTLGSVGSVDVTTDRNVAGATGVVNAISAESSMLFTTRPSAAQIAELRATRGRVMTNDTPGTAVPSTRVSNREPADMMDLVGDRN